MTRLQDQEENDEPTEFMEIYSKIGCLETHIINLIHPIQCLNNLIGPDRILQNFIQQFSSPIKIDDRPIIKAIEEFTSSLSLYSDKMNLKALIDSFLSIHSIKYRLDSLDKKIETVSERLSGIEGKIDQLCREGVKVSFSVTEKEPVKVEEKKIGKRRRFK